MLRLNGQPDPMSEAFLQMVGVFSQLELSRIQMRVRSGMASARAKGKRIGRPQVTVEDLPGAFLRHYPAYQKGYATEIYKANGFDIALVQRLLLHSSAATTQRYIGMDPQQIEQVIHNHVQLI